VHEFTSHDELRPQLLAFRAFQIDLGHRGAAEPGDIGKASCIAAVRFASPNGEESAGLPTFENANGITTGAQLSD
jgi:hypothetical protein